MKNERNTFQYQEIFDQVFLRICYIQAATPIWHTRTVIDNLQTVQSIAVIMIFLWQKKVPTERWGL